MKNTTLCEVLRGFLYSADGIGVRKLAIGQACVEIRNDLLSGLVDAGLVRPIASAAAPKADTPPHPLDQDGDGEPGGSLPAAERGLDDLRQRATGLGVKVDNRWGEKRLQDEISAALGAPRADDR